MSTISHEPDEESFHAILPENVDWERFAGLPSAARLAILVGDVKRAGTYVIRVKMPMGTRVMPQRHPEDRVYTVISGVFHMGLGEEFNETALLTFPPGAVVVLPGGQPHFHFAKSGEFVVQITAMGPLGLEYVNRVQDPRYSFF